MRFSTRRKALLLLACVVWMGMAAREAATAPPPPLPNPVIYYLGPEFYKASGKEWTRYRFDVLNQTDYPNELFAAAPELPPCGSNKNSSRTWIDIYDQSGKRLNGFCALGKRDDLGKLWFALETDVVPPSWIYIEMTDRKTGTKYKSNLAETTL